MLADELRQAKLRADAQAIERNNRPETRTRSKSISTDDTLLPLISSSSNTSMEAQQYSKIIDSIPIFSGNPRENVHEWLDLVVLKFGMIG